MARCDCFDFAVSWDFFRAHCVEYHGFDPGSNMAPNAPWDPAQGKPQSTPQVIEHIHRHSDMGRAEFDLLQQTALKVEHLEKRLNQRRQKGKY